MLDAGTTRAGNGVYAATTWGMNGWSESMRQELLPSTRVILIQPGAVHTELPTHITHEATREAVQNGYAKANVQPKEIVEVICTISLGRRYLTPAVADLLAQQLNRKDDAPPHEQLSEREFQVFLKLAKGETAGEIAKALSLSVKTVSTYRTRLMEKMGLSSNSDLTYYALKNKLID